MWRALKAPCKGYPAETDTPGVRPAIPTPDNSGLKQFEQLSALSCQLVQGIFHPFGEEDGAGRCGPSVLSTALVLWIENVGALPLRFTN